MKKSFFSSLFIKNTSLILRKKRSSFSRFGSTKNTLLSLVESDSHKRILGLIFLSFVIVCIVILRLFQLQVIHGSEHAKKAFDQQYRSTTIPARRGEIFMEDTKTGTLRTVATNASFDLLYIDPQEIPDPSKIAKELAPILYTQEDFYACKEDRRKCPSGSVQFSDGALETMNSPIQDTRTKEQLILAYEQDILSKISQENVTYVSLVFGASLDIMEQVEQLALSGITVLQDRKLVYANPEQVPQNKREEYATILSPIVGISKEQLVQSLTSKKVRYVPLKRRLDPLISEEISRLKSLSYQEHMKDKDNTPYYYKGVVLLPEHWRHYPEETLASHVIGYTDNDGIGRYGVEEKFHDILRGKSGFIVSKNDIRGRIVSYDSHESHDAQDGQSIVLTIDPLLQKKAEELLTVYTEAFFADSGSIIVVDPFTGEIVVNAHYPHYNPNDIGKVYELMPIAHEDTFPQNKKVFPTQPVFIRNASGVYEQVTYGWLQTERETIQRAKELQMLGEVVPEEQYTPKQKYVYKNRWGLQAYADRSTLFTYEPGSVFKPIIIAIGLEAKQITPEETYNETGPIVIDTGTGKKQYIRTALHVYRGIQTITNALERSSNIGMVYVARKLGGPLMYKYILDFGYADYTNIDIPGEQKGVMTYYKRWTEAQLYTTSFGQGISATPLQVVSSWIPLANGGVLMQPHFVKSVISVDGTKHAIPPKVIRRVISEETSHTISSMLVSTVDVGIARVRKEGYHVAAKTGTAQIACSDRTRCTVGQYETGEGSTITSIIGYAPAIQPRFLLYVKFDRPRNGDNTWGETTAGPVFKEMLDYLIQYYDIAPTR